MIYIFDTSALKWAYLDRSRYCRRCRYIISRYRGQVHVAEISVLEIVSALAVKFREHNITVRAFSRANGLFLQDIAEGKIVVLPFASSELVACRDLLTLVGVHAARALKSQDAIIAYTARRLALERGETVKLLTSDRRLSDIVQQLPIFQKLVISEYLTP